jgi:hypothetical protein
MSKEKQKTPKAPTPKTPKRKHKHPAREDPNGPFAPRATTKDLDATKCVAAQLGAVGNERQCGRARVDGEWCKWHGPTHRAEQKTLSANSAASIDSAAKTG